MTEKAAATHMCFNCKNEVRATATGNLSYECDRDVTSLEIIVHCPECLYEEERYTSMGGYHGSDFSDNEVIECDAEEIERLLHEGQCPAYKIVLIDSMVEFTNKVEENSLAQNQLNYVVDIKDNPQLLEVAHKLLRFVKNVRGLGRGVYTDDESFPGVADDSYYDEPDELWFKGFLSSNICHIGEGDNIREYVSCFSDVEGLQNQINECLQNAHPYDAVDNNLKRLLKSAAWDLSVVQYLTSNEFETSIQQICFSQELQNILWSNSFIKGFTIDVDGAFSDYVNNIVPLISDRLELSHVDDLCHFVVSYLRRESSILSLTSIMDELENLLLTESHHGIFQQSQSVFKKGLDAEIKFSNWMNKRNYFFIYLQQDSDSMAKAFKNLDNDEYSDISHNPLKRPDYLIHLTSYGTIVCDVKCQKIFSNYKNANAECLTISEIEFNKACNFTAEFGLNWWWAYECNDEWLFMTTRVAKTYFRSEKHFYESGAHGPFAAIPIDNFIKTPFGLSI